jgi:hypothetical protein
MKNVMAFVLSEKTRHNSAVKTLIQQRFNATNYEPAPVEDEREGASLLVNHKGDNPTSFAPTSEFASPDSLASQTTSNLIQDDDKVKQDWSKSFFGLSAKAFPQETIDILMAPIAIEDIECKPGRSSNLF